MGDEKTERVDQQEELADFSNEKNGRNNESPGKALVPLQIKDLDSFSKPSQKDEAECEGVRTTVKFKDRDVALARVETEKRLALVKAWEDNEKTKADNKADKKLSAIDAWENTKRASVEAQLKQIEENFEKKKVEYAEKMKNKASAVHMAAEEKRATIEADRGKEFVMVEEAAAKFRATGNVPTKLFACFSC